MFEIVSKQRLTPTVVRMEIMAPRVAAKAQPGQFIILRVDSEGERIPLTVSDYDRDKGTVSIVYQIVGSTTRKLDEKNPGDFIENFAGPLGNPTETEGYSRVCVVGGGVGCAIAYPVARKLAENGAIVDTVIGFRNKDLVIFKDEFEKISTEFKLMTDDGTAGEKGLVTDALKMLAEKNHYDHVIAIGPLIMMKFVCKLTKELDIPTTVSMNPIMVDGTGMCGGCRLTVGGKTVFACVDGPDFDGHQVDFDETMRRNTVYRDFEAHAYEKTCNLFAKEEK